MQLLDEVLNSLEAEYDKIVCDFDKVGNSGSDLNRIIKKILKYINRFPDSHDLYLLLGLCYYRFPLSNKKQMIKAESSFLKAIEIAPDYYWSHYNLACLYFDQAYYEKALNTIIEIPKDFFSHYEQIWRDLKVEELIICCKYNLVVDDSQLDIAAFIAFTQKYQNEIEEDRPLPDEIVTCISKLKAKIGNTDKADNLVALLLEFIEIIGLKNRYIERFKRVV